MKTDTPRTDALVGGRDEIDRCLPTVALLARQLERELTAVTEQRDRLAVALRNCLPFITGDGCGEYSDAIEALHSLTTNELTSEKI